MSPILEPVVRRPPLGSPTPAAPARDFWSPMPSRVPHTARIVAAFATLYVVWGSTYLFIRIGLDAGMPPALFGGLRLVPAGLLLFGLALARRSGLRISRRDLTTASVVGILLLCGGMYGTFLAEQYIPSGLAALIVALLPLWIAAAEAVIPGMDRPTWMGWLGLTIGFVGLAVLMIPTISGFSGSPEQLLGVAIEIIATWLWTAGTIVSKRRPLKVDGTVATGYEMLVAGGVLLVLGLAQGEWTQLPAAMSQPAGIGSLVYLIVVGSALAFTAFMWLIRNVTASKVMTYAYVNPVVAVFLGWLVLSEPVDGWTLAGMAIIVAGVALTTAAPVRPGSLTVGAPLAEPSEI